MSDIRKEIHESCDNFVRDTGLTPTRIYLGWERWMELMGACSDMRFRPLAVPMADDRPHYSGLAIYLADERDHLHVTR